MKFKLLEEFLSESKADEQRLIDFAGINLAKRFFALKQRFKTPENDLYYWIKNKTPQELEQAVSNLENTKSNAQQRKEAVSGAKLVCESEHWKVYHITTFEASQYYGRDTRWCITGINHYGDTYWKRYTENDIEFYFIITKQDYDERGYQSKYALGIHIPSGCYEVYNQQDLERPLSDIPYLEEIKIPDIDIADLDRGFPFEGFCIGCGVGLGEWEWYYGPDDQCYCHDCFYERFFTCAQCEEDYELDEHNETAYGEWICDDCLAEYFGYCEVCGEIYPQDELQELDGDLMCSGCYDEVSSLTKE